MKRSFGPLAVSAHPNLADVSKVASGPPLTRFFEDGPRKNTTDTIVQLFYLFMSGVIATARKLHSSGFESHFKENLA
jgi:hypothetical protein